MTDQLRSFFERLMQEPKFRETFASAKTAYEGYIMAMPYIQGVTFAEFKDGLTYIHNKAPYRRKLLNTDLHKVSGGTDVLFLDVLSILAQYDGNLF